MSKTTLIKKRTEMKREPLPHCHDGQGALDWIEVLDSKDLNNHHLKFVHDDLLAPGVTIGIHTHQDDEEYYYIVAGHGVMTLDGTRFEVEAGDITAVYPGGSHGLENTGTEEMRIVVFCAS